MAFTDYLNSLANVWRNSNVSGETQDEHADAPATWSLAAVEACRVTMTPQSGTIGRADRGFGQAIVVNPRVSLNPAANVLARDVLEIFDGPQAPLWLRVPGVEKAQGPQATHHLVIHGEPTHIRLVEES